MYDKDLLDMSEAEKNVLYITEEGRPSKLVAKQEMDKYMQKVKLRLKGENTINKGPFRNLSNLSVNKNCARFSRMRALYCPPRWQNLSLMIIYFSSRKLLMFLYIVD